MKNVKNMVQNGSKLVSERVELLHITSLESSDSQNGTVKSIKIDVTDGERKVTCSNVTKTIEKGKYVQIEDLVAKCLLDWRYSFHSTMRKPATKSYRNQDPQKAADLEPILRRLLTDGREALDFPDDFLNLPSVAELGGSSASTIDFCENLQKRKSVSSEETIDMECNDTDRGTDGSHNPTANEESEVSKLLSDVMLNPQEANSVELFGDE